MHARRSGGAGTSRRPRRRNGNRTAVWRKQRESVARFRVVFPFYRQGVVWGPGFAHRSIDPRRLHLRQHERHKGAVARGWRGLGRTGTVYLATDGEGEAIAWRLGELLGESEARGGRVTFSEVTPATVERPRGSDYDLVHAPAARRRLDRVVSSTVSCCTRRRGSIGAGRRRGRRRCLPAPLVRALRPADGRLDAALARAAPAGFGSVGDRSSRPAASARRWWRQPTRPLCPVTTVQDGDDDADEFLALPLQLADRD